MRITIERSRVRIVHRIFKYSDVLKAFTLADRISTAATITGLSRNTVSRVVREFEKLGLLEREGRRINVTAKGKEILKLSCSFRELLSKNSPKTRSEVIKGERSH